MRVLAVLALCACGASARDIAMAKTAHYKGDKLALFREAREVVSKKHHIEAADETTLTLVTKPRWYTPEGLVSHWNPGEQAGDPHSAGANMSGRTLLVDGRLNIKLVVKVLPDGDHWIVYVEPRYLQFRDGRPNLDPLKPDDPSIPGWASGKVDQLAYAIYKRLRPYEVRVANSAVPPPAPTSSPPPPDPTPVVPAPEPEPEPPTQPETAPVIEP